MTITRRLHALAAAGLGAALLAQVSPAGAQSREVLPESGAGIAASVVGIGGVVTATASSGRAIRLAVGSPLCYGDRVVTGEDASVELRFAGANTTTGASANTVVLLPPSPEAAYDLTVESGLIRFISSVRGYFEIRSPLVNAGIDGTEAMVLVDGLAADTLVLVREGKVTVTDRRIDSARLAIAAGQAAFASRATTLEAATPENVPERFLPYLLRPQDAADWAVYYPPVLLGAEVGSPLVREAAGRLAAGDPAGADALLKDAALAPQGEAAALAVRSVAAVYRNRAATGLDLARAAVAADPGLGAASIALSYALQAQGQIEAAREAASAATAAAPGDAYAWARLAELDLTLGAYGRTRDALDRSLAIRETALARSIEGFLALAGTRLDPAEAAFARAIALDGNDPLPRLGLGLARIRGGRLAEGRADIEAAVALDPRRASLRTWLGRVYFEERQPPKAAAQFVIAEEEDPQDPTPHFFSALERFAANDPIGALADIETAQALGEARGTQRGRAGLAEDRAARGAALGRVHDTLGFEALAAVTGTQAVEDDPTSPEAHFFLSDAYLGRQGYEVAQSSEFMLGQILSPPNRALVQPRLAETDLALLQGTGPTRATFAEFSPLVTGNGVSLGVAGGVGTQDTWGVESSAAVLHGPFSLAVGQFSSSTDGYVQNNFVDHDIYALEGRAQIGPRVSLFAELRHRESKWGDRVIDFGDLVSPDLRQTLERDSARAALHFAAAPGQDLVVVGTWADLDETVRDCVPPPSGFVGYDLNSSEGAYGLEARYFGRFGRTQATAGGSYAHVDIDGTSSFSGPPFGGCGVPAPGEPADDAYKSRSAFAYLTSQFSGAVEATLGVSVNHFQQTGYSVSQVDPKLGLRVTLGRASSSAPPTPRRSRAR